MATGYFIIFFLPQQISVYISALLPIPFLLGAFPSCPSPYLLDCIELDSLSSLELCNNHTFIIICYLAVFNGNWVSTDKYFCNHSKQSFLFLPTGISLSLYLPLSLSLSVFASKFYMFLYFDFLILNAFDIFIQLPFLFQIRDMWYTEKCTMFYALWFCWYERLKYL